MKRNCKSIILFIATIVLGTSVYGQYFKEKDKVLNFGIGLGTSLYSGSGYSMTIPPLSASFEYGLKEGVGPGVIGIGGYLGIAGSKYESGYYDWGWKYTYTVIGARGTYHLVDLADKFDFYGGLMLGYVIVSSKETGTRNLYSGSAESSFANLSIFAGARYYLQDNFALMAELGYGVAILNLGVSLKF
jgi:hypothetical protein